MSVRRLHQLLAESARDGKITTEEVAALIEASKSEGVLSAAERFTLEAALEAHKDAFTPEAFRALLSYLGGRSS